MMDFVPLINPTANVIGIGENIHLQLPSRMHKNIFIDFVKRNKKYHEPWVYVSSDPRFYDQYISRMKMGKTFGVFVFTNTDNQFVGVINLNSIRLDPFSSATLGYYAEQTLSGKGYMKEALNLILDHAFIKIGLNRVEVNVQPNNIASLALIKSVGFTKEGFSRKYLKIGNHYEDHERWAYLAEDFKFL